MSNLQILFEIVGTLKMILHSVCFRSKFAAVIMGDTVVAVGERTAEYFVLGEKAWKKLPSVSRCTPGVLSINTCVATACVLPS